MFQPIRSFFFTGPDVQGRKVESIRLRLQTTGAPVDTQLTVNGVTSNTVTVTATPGNAEVYEFVFDVDAQANVLNGSNNTFSLSNLGTLQWLELSDPGNTLDPFVRRNGGGGNVNVDIQVELNLAAPRTVNGTDFDGDGIFNHLDIDSDNDGITDNVEAQATADYIAPSGTGPNEGSGGVIDLNDDGLDDNFDSRMVNESTAAATAADVAFTPTDTDSDGDADYIDTDSDDDGVEDAAERGTPGSITARTNVTSDSTTDADGDGLLDEFENASGSTVDADNNSIIDALEDGFDVNDENIVGDDGGADGSFTSFNLAANDPNLNADGSNATPLTQDLDFRDNTDTDSDGVVDSVDVDDDNDGILDVDELNTTQVTGDEDFSSQSPGIVNATTFTNAGSPFEHFGNNSFFGPAVGGLEFGSGNLPDDIEGVRQTFSTIAGETYVVNFEGRSDLRDGQNQVTVRNQVGDILVQETSVVSNTFTAEFLSGRSIVFIGDGNDFTVEARNIVGRTVVRTLSVSLVVPADSDSDGIFDLSLIHI